MNRQWIFVAQPTGDISQEQFAYHEAPVPEPGPGEFLMRSLYLSCDPAMYGWMKGASYIASLRPGDVMLSRCVAQVIRSRHDGYQEGDIVIATNGWQDYAVSAGTDRAGDAIVKLPSDLPPAKSFHVLGSSGLTAYFGLLDVGVPRPGDTLLVSGAAGAVGSLTGQIGRIAGCRVVGVAGSDEKVRYLTEDLRFDAAINYKTERTIKRLATACPDGVDVFFDNVGGPVAQAGFAHLAFGARVVICGGIAGYADPRGSSGFNNYMQLVSQKARAEGFLVTHFAHRYEEGRRRLAHWMRQGLLAAREDILEGFDQAPEGLIGLFRGDNIGKRLIHIGDPAV